ncbi:DUF1329 domain-containing protein [Aromatoleum toluclasticum]|uniref:DUF1329 domain-containing protein n=1 Tax=Aromatoleum toluclasticum TaxID=92003 RepID=UPI001D18EAC8|nr:DUF1329 domain-containing protein [Aromatoleum toluclasticum]MCC4118482.1 DUF1329 domain-containing protein [Aromatoleum toluclasticum]
MQSMKRIRQTVVAGLGAFMTVAGAIAAELPEGTVIDKSSIDRIKSDTFEGKTIASLLTEKLEWQIRNWNLKLTLSHSKPVELNQRYKDCSKKYADQVKYDPATREVSGWVCGVPFPNVSADDPHAGDKLIWNFYYASPEGDIAHNRLSYLQINGDKGLESTQDWLFLRYYYKGRTSDDNHVLDDGSVLTKTLFVATAPQDVKGVGTFTVRYDSPKMEDTWAYIKSARRTRRLSGGAWMDPIGGLDQLNDDIYIWNARPSWYPKIKLLSRRWILASTDAKLGYDSTKKDPVEQWGRTTDLKNPPYWNPIQTWQPREVWVIEGTPPEEHPYSKKIVYMDVNYPKIYLGEAYDKKGEFWKFLNFHIAPTVGQDGSKVQSSIQGETIDFKARHATIFVYRQYSVNDKGIKATDMSLSQLEAIAR